MAQITFYGAVNGVTGSAYLIEVGKHRLLLECGLIQGSHDEEAHNSDPFPFDIKQLDAMVLSHAHLDHSGRLPKLSADGYDGPIYTTLPTLDLLEVMLKDAAFLAERDVEWENRRRERAGKELLEPLYTIDDVESALRLCRGIRYGHRQEVMPGVEICFRDAGHILGSAIVELFITEGSSERKLVFSGDLGNSCAALLRDPEVIDSADVLMLESTYGDRDHQSLDATLAEFRSILEQAEENGGNVLIPSFAVGRTQEIIFRLGELYQEGVISHQAVYLDSPMAIATTEIYHRYQHMFNEEDAESMNQARGGSLHKFLPTLKYSRTTEESMAINRITGGAIIIAGSGMCTGGRIRHHLKHNLWRRDAHVMIVGYQARGTPGRALVDGTEKLRLAGEEIAVRASIHTLGGFSAHASQTQLLEWVSRFSRKPERILLVHGEDDAKAVLQQRLHAEGYKAAIPVMGQKVEI